MDRRHRDALEERFQAGGDQMLHEAGLGSAGSAQRTLLHNIPAGHVPRHLGADQELAEPVGVLVARVVLAPDVDAVPLVPGGS